MTAWTIPLVMLLGSCAGMLGALLGIGGGVFFVPFLVTVVGLPFTEARGISLLTVIATSSAVAAGNAGRRVLNMRLAMVLEVAAAAGGLAGGITSALLSERTLTWLFAIVLAAIAVVMASRIDQRNVILDPEADPGRLGARYFDRESGFKVTYQMRRLPVAFLASFLGGNVSSLLGIGGGILMVPALNAWCGVPMRAAAATSAFMIGVTAVAAAPIYYARGQILPELAAAGVLGVLVGSRAGLWLAERAPTRSVKGLMISVLVSVSIIMMWRAR